MSRKKFNLAVTLAMTLIILSSTISLAAAPTVFTDINGHWAKSFIEDIYNRKITSGYTDATFRPERNITKLETIAMIAKLMGYSNSEEEYYINKYRQQLIQNSIPDWGQGTVAYALSNNILMESELPELVSANSQTNAKRYEVAIYIGRALQYGVGQQLETIFVIPYKDEMSIPGLALPYIDLLLRNSILDKTSNDGRFLPNDLIKRSEIAKMISLTAKIVDEGSITIDIPSPEPTNPSKTVVKETINGYIDNIILGTKNILSIENKGRVQVYDVSPNAMVRISNNIAYIEDLRRGQELTATVEDNIIVDIRVSAVDGEVVEGYFYYYLDGTKPMVYIKDENDTVRGFSFMEGSKVYLLDKLVDIKDLSIGDIVNITYNNNNEIVVIDGKPRERKVEGVVKSKNISKDEYVLEVSLNNREVETFTITSKTSIKRDNRNVYFDSIKIGDKVELTLDYDTVIDLYAFSTRENIGGYINNISFGEKMKIAVEMHDGTTETFVLTPNTNIRVEGQRADAYDLRPNYEVKLELENDEVVNVEAYYKIEGTSYTGKIIYKDARAGTLELQTRTHNNVIIYIDGDTIYNDEDGKLIRYRDLEIDDEVAVYAEDNGFYITAKRVLVLIRRR